MGKWKKSTPEQIEQSLLQCLSFSSTANVLEIACSPWIGLKGKREINKKKKCPTCNRTPLYIVLGYDGFPTLGFASPVRSFIEAALVPGLLCLHTSVFQDPTFRYVCHGWLETSGEAHVGRHRTRSPELPLHLQALVQREDNGVICGIEALLWSM